MVNVGKRTDTIALKSPRASQRKGAGWCVVELETVSRTHVLHVGRGRFVVLKDNQEGRYVGRIINASEILARETKRAEI